MLSIFNVRMFLSNNEVAFIALYQDQRGFPQELFAVKMYALTTEMPKKILGKVQANRPGIIK